MTETIACPVCDSKHLKTTYRAREMLHGLRDEFTYLQCPDCSYLWLPNPPANMQPYYPRNYYSYRDASSLKSWLKAVRGAHAFGRKNILSQILVRKFGFPPVVGWLQPLNPNTSYSILDVGCGQGIALRDLSRAGFKNLDGIDPFLSEERQYGQVSLKKMDLFSVTKTYDIIMLNHSFEHMLEQKDVLLQIQKILSPRGSAIIRIPIQGEAWREFGVNWYALDPPRHYSIHTVGSFEKLLTKTEMKISRIVYDSDEHHYLASRQYIADIPFMGDKSYTSGIDGSMFSDADIAAARLKAQLANERKDGDQATFYLQRKQ